MSGIAGIWHRDKKPLMKSTLFEMAQTLSHRGKDGIGYYAKDDVGFACQQFFTNTHSRKQIARQQNLIICFDGRIDNRDELISRFGQSNSDDIDLIMTAYSHCGLDFARHLKGDFAIAIADRDNDRIVLCRDPIGLRPLHYTTSSKLVAFASEIKALLSHPEISVASDKRGLSNYILGVSNPFGDLDRTCFKNIKSVPPSHICVIDRQGIRSWRYWDFDPSRKLKLKNFDEYAEAFRELFSQSVRRRSRSPNPVAVSLSGGLDSTSIYCGIDELIGNKQTETPDVIGISYTSDGGMSDEREFVKLIELQRNKAVHRVPMASHLGIVASAQEQLYHIEAPFLEYMWGVSSAVHSQATHNQARIFLTGHWGDQLMFSVDYLSDLFTTLRWGTIRNHLQQFGSWLHKDEVQFYKRYFVRQALKRSVPQALRPLAKRMKQRLTKRRPLKSVFTDSFVELSLANSDLDAFFKDFHSQHAISTYKQARSKYHVMCMEWNNKAMAANGLEAAFPFLDQDLIAFLMSIPGEVLNQGGIPRALLREAMRGTIPEPVANRTWKADFTDIVNDSVAGDLPQLLEYLNQDSLVVQQGLVRWEELQNACHQIQNQLKMDNNAAAWDLVDLYGLELWLQTFFGKSGCIKKQGEASETQPKTFHEATLSHT